MFSFFKKAEPKNNSSKLELTEMEKGIIETNQEAQDLEQIDLSAQVSPEKVFSQSVYDIKEYLRLNGKIDPETIEIMTGMSLEQTFATLEKNEDLKMELSVKDLKEAVVEALKVLEGPARNDWLRKFVNKPAVKGIFVAVMLFLKFAPDVQGAEKKEVDNIKADNKIEASFDQNESTDDPNTYQFEESNLEGVTQIKKGDAKEMSVEGVDLEGFSKLELSNYYATDSDLIPEKNVQEIKNQFKNFLDKVNSDNFQEILETDFEIFGSSDERPTNNWEGSNEKLSRARIASAEKIFKSVLNEYDFGDRLNMEQQKQLKGKEFKAKMPDKGVTRLVDLINPDTGLNYTEDEISSLSEEEKLELLKDCRRIDVNFLAKKDVKAVKEMQPKALDLDELRIESVQNTFKNWNDYKSVSLIVDNSPSMDRSYDKIAEIIQEQADLKHTEIKFGTFSDNLNDLKKLDGLNEVAKAIKDMDRNGSHQERIIKSALSAIEKMQGQIDGKIKLLVATDEPLQDLNYAELQQLKVKAQQKNCEVDIIYAHNRQGGVAQILSLEQLTNAYQELAWQDLSVVAKEMLKSEEAKLNRLNSTKSALEQAVNRNLDRENVKQSVKTKKNVEDYQGRLLDLSEKISQSQLLLSSLESGLSEGNLAALELAIKENNSRYKNYRLEIDPSLQAIGVNIVLSQNK